MKKKKTETADGFDDSDDSSTEESGSGSDTESNDQVNDAGSPEMSMVKETKNRVLRKIERR